jgi:hypothetical protein
LAEAEKSVNLSRMSGFLRLPMLTQREKYYSYVTVILNLYYICVTNPM